MYKNQSNTVFTFWFEMNAQDETFPELGVGSVEGCDDQESVCSSNEREGDAFPKAFDRELVTPTNLQKTQSESVDSKANENETKESNTSNTDKTNDDNNSDDSYLGKEFKEMRTLEERRRSLLDHHWAVPSKDKWVEFFPKLKFFSFLFWT